MSDQPIQKKVDESWKEQVEREKQQAPPPDEAAGRPGGPVIQPGEAGGAAKGGAQEYPEARFDLFISGLAVEALVALGDMPHPVTRKPAVDLAHARYLIDLMGMCEEKTKGNLTVDEERLLKDTLYQLRMRYLAKTTGAGTAPS